jgi:hypothetical protein
LAAAAAALEQCSELLRFLSDLNEPLQFYIKYCDRFINERISENLGKCGLYRLRAFQLEGIIDF